MPPIKLPKVKLNDGLQIPVLAFGTGSATYQKSCKDGVRMAYAKAHMRHLDCAEWYRNEGDVGTVLRELAVKREEVFITTKCKPDPEHIAAPMIAYSPKLRGRTGGDDPVDGFTDPRESLKRSLESVRFY
jgi:diketogulonate reductase-like aldo/keto reductase